MFHPLKDMILRLSLNKRLTEQATQYVGVVEFDVPGRL